MGKFVRAGLAAALSFAQTGAEDYMARIDPSLRTWTRSVRVAQDSFLDLEVHQGQLRAYQDGQQLDLPEEHMMQLAAAFPAEAFEKEALNPPIAIPEARAQRYGASVRIDPGCPVNSENHLERTTVAVFRELKSSPLGVVVTLGGLYGYQSGEGAEIADDPAVELLLEMQQQGLPARALCLGCPEGQVASLTRAQTLQQVFTTRQLPESLRSNFPELPLPLAFQGGVDLLRLDALPHGSSCQVLRAILRAGVRPRLVALFVQSQVPPPFKFVPLGQVMETPAAIMACSLSAAMEVLAPWGLFLIRLTGPYALFVHRDEWYQELPINELDCYRRASVWGLQDIPLRFVREWFFEDVDQVLPLVWRNLSSLYRPGEGLFTLGV
ncbi:unnamed protein product [Effrenium voratum]|nr:unnamed protein product [Effrenium voratum]